MYVLKTVKVTTAIAAALALAAGGATVAAAAATAPDAVITATKLKDNKVVTMPKPGKSGDHYWYGTTTPRWSVVATDPEYYLDVDLSLYSDDGEKFLLKQSTVTTGGTDFIAIDSGERGLDPFLYAAVDPKDGKGTYKVELAQGDKVLDGYSFIPAKEAAIVSVRDTLLVAGTNYRFVYWPMSTSGNGDLYLMSSEPDDDDSWIRNRDEAIRYSEAPGGKASVIDFTPTRTDVYGLVMTSTGVKSDFGLQRVVY